MGESHKNKAKALEKPANPKKRDIRDAEVAIKSHKRRNVKKKTKLSWMLPLGVTIAIISFFMAMQFRGQSNELEGTWWNNEWMDEEDFSDDITIQQRRREMRMQENKEKRNAQKRKRTQKRLII